MSEQRNILNKHRLPDGRTELRAHDVRHLRACTSCGLIGDNRTMIHCMVWGVEEHFHGSCAVERLGDHVLRLPVDERNKLTLKDTGADLMKRLLALTDEQST